MKQYRLVIISLILLVVAGCGMAQREQEQVYRVITKYEELTQLLENFPEDGVLLDLRDNREYENAHCIGSINVPFDDDGSWLMKCLEEQQWQNKTIYLMCGGGKRSGDAFNLLTENKIPRVVYITFGYEEYIGSQGYENSEGGGVCDCYQQ